MFRFWTWAHRSSHCRSKQKKKNKRSEANENIVLSKNDIEEGQRWKYLNVNINGHTVKLLLDSGSDILVINEQTWKKNGCPLLTNTDKIARGVSVKRLKLKGELKCNILFIGTIHKSKVLPGSVNLFGTDWIVLFNL